MTEPNTRLCWIGAPAVFLLEQSCFLLFRAFGEMPYLVGSATQRRDYRDVDVRIILEDAQYTALFGHPYAECNMLWSVICSAISEWLQRRTGLPVDFQIQARSYVKEADWEKPRVPIGMYPKRVNPAWQDAGERDDPAV